MNPLIEVNSGDIESVFSKEITLDKGRTLCASLLSLRLMPSDGKEDYEVVRRTRLDAKRIKVSIEKARKGLVAGANAYVSSVNDYARELVGTFASGVDYAEGLELAYVDAKKREQEEADNAKAAKKASRISTLFVAGMVFNGTAYTLGNLIISPLSMESMTDDLFEIFLTSLAAEKEKIQALAVIEADKRKAEAEIERQRLDVEREAARLILATQEKKRADEYTAMMAEVAAAKEVLAKQMAENAEVIRLANLAAVPPPSPVPDLTLVQSSVLPQTPPPIQERPYMTIQNWAGQVRALIEIAPDKENPIMQRCLVALEKVYDLAIKEARPE